MSGWGPTVSRTPKQTLHLHSSCNPQNKPLTNDTRGNQSPEKWSYLHSVTQQERVEPHLREGGWCGNNTGSGVSWNLGSRPRPTIYWICALWYTVLCPRVLDFFTCGKTIRLLWGLWIVPCTGLGLMKRGLLYGWKGIYICKSWTSPAPSPSFSSGSSAPFANTSALQCAEHGLKSLRLQRWRQPPIGWDGGPWQGVRLMPQSKQLPTKGNISLMSPVSSKMHEFCVPCHNIFMFILIQK